MRFENWLENQKNRKDEIGNLAQEFLINAVNNPKGENMEHAKCELPCASEVSLQATSNAMQAASERVGIANMDATSKVGDAVCDSTRDLMENIHSASVQGVNATERNGEQNREATHATERAVSKSVWDSYAGLSQSARDILAAQCEGVKDVLLQGASQTSVLQDKICESTRDVLLQASNVHSDLKSQICDSTKDLLLQGSHNTADVRKDICEGVGDIKAQSADHFKDLLLQAANNQKENMVAQTLNAKDAEISRLRNAKDASLERCENTAALQASAADNAAKLAAQIAECCCELKSIVIEKNNDTDQLIRAQAQKEVERELQECKLELLLAKQEKKGNS